MNNELISVIVPIYNVEKYLNRCVDSIINQTYKNLEIFLVDDGSTDNCPKICDEYELKDSRIHVIHKKNGGLSDARNVAIDIASGEYLTFVDSDDFISLKMIEILYKSLKKNNSDISSCSYFNYYDGDRIIDDCTITREFVYDDKAALENMLYQKDVTTCAWAKLYRRELFNEIRYPFGKICEDLPTTYLLFSKAKKITIINLKLYYYLQRKDSIINSKFNKKRMDAMDFVNDIVDFIEKKYCDISFSAYNRAFAEAYYILEKIPLKKIYYNEINYIWINLKKYRKYILKDKKSRKYFKFIALNSYLGKYCFYFNLKILKIIRYIKSCFR